MFQSNGQNLIPSKQKLAINLSTILTSCIILIKSFVEPACAQLIHSPAAGTTALLGIKTDRQSALRLWEDITEAPAAC